MIDPTRTSLDRLTRETTRDRANHRRLDGVVSGVEDPAADASSNATLLTSEQVDQLRLRHEAGESLNSLAREFRTTCASLLQLVVRRW